MISPIIAAQASTQAAAIQRSGETQGVLQNQNAYTNVREEERQAREIVTTTEEAVFYEQRYDAKEESKNKYENLYTKKKKKSKDETSNKDEEVSRVNFDIKI